MRCVALRCVALRCVALRCVALRCVALRCVALRCVALRCVALRCVALRCVALRCVALRCVALRCVALRCVALRCVALRCVALRCVALRCVALRCVALRCVALRCVALRCVALRCVALRCVALRCVALRCVALRCVALRCVALRCVALEIVLKADRKLFGHIIVVAQTRTFEMKKVLSYHLDLIPWALANADRSLRKTDKAKFMHDIAQNVPVVEVFTEKSACIEYGMSIVQKLDGNQKTFGDIAKTVLTIVIREGDQCDRVDVVFDVYREGSIKDAERVNRGSGSGVKFRSLATGHKVKQWRSFLPEAQNKTMLIEFITEEWKSNKSKSMIGQKTIFVTCGQKCWRIGQMGASLVNDLKSSQEEADTRILLHATKHASD